MSETAGRWERWLRAAKAKDLGAFGERLWSNLFQSAGLGYVPLCQIAIGRAPSLEGNERLILPDFSVSSNRFRVYVDSKAKTCPVYFRLASELRHGIERRHWLNYREFSCRERTTCCLAVFEAFHEGKDRWSGALLVQSLQRLGEPYPPSANKTAADYDVVLWPRTRFSELGNVQPEGLNALLNHHNGGAGFKERLWEILELSSGEPVQMTLF